MKQIIEEKVYRAKKQKVDDKYVKENESWSANINQMREKIQND
jgi:hypothetical protein